MVAFYEYYLHKNSLYQIKHDEKTDGIDENATVTSLTDRIYTSDPTGKIAKRKMADCIRKKANRLKTEIAVIEAFVSNPVVEETPLINLGSYTRQLKKMPKDTAIDNCGDHPSVACTASYAWMGFGKVSKKLFYYREDLGKDGFYRACDEKGTITPKYESYMVDTTYDILAPENIKGSLILKEPDDRVAAEYFTMLSNKRLEKLYEDVAALENRQKEIRNMAVVAKTMPAAIDV